MTNHPGLRGIPHLLVLAVTIASLLLASNASAAPVSKGHVASQAISSSAFCADADEVAFVGLINAYRKANGLSALALTQTLSTAAEHHSASMANNNYFSHTLVPEGISWSQNIKNHGYDFNTFRGENIAAGNSTPDRTFDQWKASPTHNDNMLNPNFKAMGIGKAYGAESTYKTYWTNTFGGHVDTIATKCAATDPGTLAITSSSRSSASTSSLNAYDQNVDTSWYTTSSTPPRSATIVFDLGRSRTLTAIEYKFSSSMRADDVRIEVSRDKTTWTQVASFSNPAAKVWLKTSTKASARYVRFYFRNPNGEFRLGYLSEVRIHGA